MRLLFLGPELVGECLLSAFKVYCNCISEELEIPRRDPVWNSAKPDLAN